MFVKFLDVCIMFLHLLNKQKNNDNVVIKLCVINKFNWLIILTYYEITLVTTNLKGIEMCIITQYTLFSHVPLKHYAKM